MVFVILAVIISVIKPSPDRYSKPRIPVLQVVSQTVDPQPYQFTISSFGTVQPRTQSLLVSQVNGQIIDVNPAFRDGGFFNKDEILIRIDDRDYASAVKVAQANLLRAKLAMEEEKALARQAEQDWERLGDGENATDLVLRIPQMAAAEAGVMSEQANLEKAELDLQRTRVRAPFDGRILTADVDVGQFVNTNAPLAEVFATDVVEIRLPLKNSDLNLIDLPENYRGKKVPVEEYPHVTITSSLGEQQHWDGLIVRAEAALDSNSHQLYVVGQIQDPFAIHNSDKLPLKIGQYVTAQIEGRKIDNALVIPTSSLYQGSYVYAIENGLLQRREVQIAFQTPLEVVIASGLDTGIEVVISPLGQVASGTRVNSNKAQASQTSLANSEAE